MSAWRPELHLDPRGPTAEAVALAPIEGAFAVAMRAAARGDHLQRLSFAVPLALYAYELLERLRQAAPAAPAVVHAPFWPQALCAAGSVWAPAVPQVVSMYPSFSAVRVFARDAAEISAAATKLFALLPFDPARYGPELMSVAEQRGWTVTGPT